MSNDMRAFLAVTVLVLVLGAVVEPSIAATELFKDEAGRVMVLLTAHRTIVETVDLEQRIIKLEEKK